MARLEFRSTKFPDGVDMRQFPGPDLASASTAITGSGSMMTRIYGDSTIVTFGTGLQGNASQPLPTAGTSNQFLFYSDNSRTQSAYSFFDLNHQWERSVYQNGYEYNGQLVQGYQAVMAAFLEGSDNITGTSKDDYLLGYAGDDRFVGGGGNDTFDGGLGTDTVLLNSRSSESHTISRAGNSMTIEYNHLKNGATSQYDQTYIGYSIERVSFRDKSVAFDVDPGGNAGWAARLIGSLVGKHAVTDKALAGEVISYVDTYGIQTVTELLVDLGVTAALAGGADNASFFTLLYKNVVGSPPPAAELAELVGYVDSGAFTQAQALQVIAGLDLTANQIGLTGLAQTGWDYIEFGS